jgi:methyl-accepting chemotaxis protein
MKRKKEKRRLSDEMKLLSKFSVKASLKWRLLVGFLLCAILTAFSGGGGMLSLRQVQSKMEDTTIEIGTTIDDQNAQTSRLMPLRGLVSSIANAINKEELNKIETQLIQLVENKANEDSKNQLRIMKAVRDLFTHKQGQLLALDELTAFRKSYVAILGEITKLAVGMVDDAEFDSTIKIDDALTGIKDNFGMMSAEQMKSSIVNVTDTTGQAVSTIKAALAVQSYSNQLNAMAKDMLLATNSASVDYGKTEMKTLLGNINGELESLPQGETTQNITASFTKIAELTVKMGDAKNNVLAAQTQLNQATTQIWSEMSLVDDTMLKNAESLKSDAENALAASTELVDRWQFLQLVIVIGAIVVAIFVGVFVSRSITKPLNKAVSMIRDIAEGEGDLTKRLDVKSKDEMGELSRWFNTFVENLQTIIKDIAGNADTLNTSSGGLSALSSEMSGGTETMSSQSATVSTAAEEMTANMNSVAVTMEEAATNMGLIATAAEEMSSTINEIADNAEKAQNITGEAVSQAGHASDKINELGSAAQEVGKVTETIAEISDQTNLLALNATIEAARAGETGKGFAVEANEIKELSRQTAEATQDIKSKIDRIQGSTSGAVTQVEEISSVIDKVSQIVSAVAAAVEEQSAATQEIAENVAQASHGIQEVNANVTQSAAVSSKIAKDISDVNQSAAEISNGNSQVNMSAKDLANMAEQLKGMVGRFKI